MSADMQLIRTVDDDWHNCAIGEPAFLQKLTKFHSNLVEYPPIIGHEPLLVELRHLHPDSHIVVTNGAKQALLAAFWALNQLEGRSCVHHTAPHWPSYPTLAQMSGLSFASSPLWPIDISCTTSPNNPDGAESIGWASIGRPYDVWDAAYASPLYGWSGEAPEHRISVWSAAKLLGCSGYRVGWLVTQEPKLADLAAKYVEFTTSGVALPSQGMVANMLQWRRLYSSDAAEVQEDAKLALANNWAHLQDALNGWAEITNYGKGMFALVKTSDLERFKKLLVEAKVAMVTGEACGMREPGWYRVNVGITRFQMDSACMALNMAKDEV